MQFEQLEIILQSPRVLDAVNRDPLAARLAQVIDALTESLSEVPHRDGARQLGQLNWYMCQRAGGCLCDCGPTMPLQCERAQSCMLSPAH